jgi:perosamine synthetase
MIPVQRPYLGPEELVAVARVFESRWLGMGEETAAFEERLREHLGARHVVAVNTGTAALHLALAALELPPEAEVLVPSLTFVASPQAILAAGARPVFCEVDPATLTLDVADAMTRRTPRTRVIMPVHYGGQACAMDQVLTEARRHNLWVVEDAAHAFGSSWKGRKVGTLGDVTCFSFDPIKNITCGEGGAVVTDRDAIADRVTSLRQLGIVRATSAAHRSGIAGSHTVVSPGYRYHLPNINAAIGLQQLDRLEWFQQRRQEIVGRYDAAFRELPGLTLLDHDPEACPFMYVVRVEGGQRDALAAFLWGREIGSGIHYVPNHLQPLFAGSGPALPVTEALYGEILTLPLFVEMTDAEVDQVIAAVRGFTLHPLR